MIKDVQGVMSYWADPGDGSLPDIHNDLEIVVGHRDADPRTMTIHDIRGKEAEYSLDVQGFTARTLPENPERDPKVLAGDDAEYFQELTDLLKKETGAKDVIIFGKVLRQLPPGALKPREYLGAKIQPPAARPHVDVAPQAVENFVGIQLPQGLELIKKAPRWQMLGVWRPTQTVQRDPLTIADFTSVDPADYKDLPRDNTYGPDAKFVVSMMAPGKGNHKWHYLSDMKKEEVLIFKHFDSKQDGAWRSPHTSVPLVGTESLPPRESMEVRALVCY